MKKGKGSFILIGVGILIAGRTSANLWRLWKAGERVSLAQQQVMQAQQENLALKKQLAEVQSPDFVEKEARAKLGYAKPGEEIVIVEENSPNKEAGTKEESLPNWIKWRKLYLGF